MNQLNKSKLSWVIQKLLCFAKETSKRKIYFESKESLAWMSNKSGNICIFWFCVGIYDAAAERLSIDFHFIVNRSKWASERNAIKSSVSKTIQFITTTKNIVTYFKLNLCLHSIADTIWYIIPQWQLIVSTISQTEAIHLRNCFSDGIPNRLEAIDHKLLLFCHWKLNFDVCARLEYARLSLYLSKCSAKYVNFALPPSSSCQLMAMFCSKYVYPNRFQHSGECGKNRRIWLKKE